MHAVWKFRGFSQLPPHTILPKPHASNAALENHPLVRNIASIFKAILGSRFWQKKLCLGASFSKAS